MSEPAYNPAHMNAYARQTLEILEARAAAQRLLFHQARLCARTLTLTARHARKKIEADPERGMKALAGYKTQLGRTVESLQFLLDKINSV